MKEKKSVLLKSPHIFVLLFGLVLVASLLTYLVPSGELQRIKDAASRQTVVIPGSYHEVGASPVAPWLIPVKFFETITTSGVARLIFFIFIVGGSFEIILQSGCIAAICKKMISVFRGRGILIVPVFIALFSVLGFTMGLTTASIVFVPIGIAIARALGFDTITGMAMVMLGTNAGFAAGIFNPFSVGIAQNIAELPLYSGAWIRWLLLVSLLISTSIYVIGHARKIRDFASLEERNNDELWNTAEDTAGQMKLSFRQIMVLVVFGLAFCVITFGVSKFNWDISQIAVVFLVLSIVAGPLAGFGVNKTCDIFVSGCRKMMKGALIIGIAATMRVILEQGNILDTITNSLISTVNHLPAWSKLMGMFYANAVIDPVITSGSAHASVVMPIMVPMADVLGLTRQSAVFSFQLGDGLVNLISPISTTLTSCLAVSDISYGKWLRFYLPLVGIYMLIGTGFIILAGITSY